MKHIFYLIVSFGVAGFLQNSVQAQIAESVVIEWTPVEMPFGAAEVGTNTINRSGNQITFDAIADSQYVRYNGNCESLMLYTLKIGTLNPDLQPEPGTISSQNQGWFKASEYLTPVLRTACTLSE